MGKKNGKLHVYNGFPSDDNGNFFNFIVTDFLTDEKFIGFVDEIEKNVKKRILNW